MRKFRLEQNSRGTLDLKMVAEKEGLSLGKILIGEITYEEALEISDDFNYLLNNNNGEGIG